jgi:hypothetical protein
MLKSLDVLIGFSVIMLAISMSVTLIIQGVLYVLRMRSKKLLAGVAALLRQIDPDLLTEEWAGELAREILSHPMLAAGPGKLAEVVQREDLIKVVLTLAAATAKSQAVAAAAGAASASTARSSPSAAPPANAREALVAALAKTGIPNPGAALDSIRLASMLLEAEKPELAAHVRETMAVIQKAGSQFVARLNGGFDQTMDRVSHSFTSHSRIWAISISLLLAFLLQIDSFRLINRLAMDNALRATLIQQAPQALPADPVLSQNVAQLRRLATDSLITWPTDWESWKTEMAESSLFGLLLTAALLSLGAPFWFNVLSDLLKLRPLLASKEDAQRKERETSQSSP